MAASPSPDPVMVRQMSLSPLQPRAFTTGVGVAVNTTPPFPTTEFSCQFAYETLLPALLLKVETEEANARAQVMITEIAAIVNSQTRAHADVVRASHATLARVEASCRASMDCWASTEFTCDELQRTVAALRNEMHEHDATVLGLEREIAKLRGAKTPFASPPRKELTTPQSKSDRERQLSHIISQKAKFT